MHSRTLEKGKGNIIVIESIIGYDVDLIVRTVEQSTVVQTAKMFQKLMNRM